MSLLKTMTAVGLMAALSAGTALAADLSLYSDKTPWDAGMTGLAEAASKASGATIKLQDITPTDKYQAFMQTSIAGNNVPALFTWWNGQQLSDLVATGVAADLTPYWDAAVANGDYTADQKALVSVDGKPYGVLLNVANWVTFYNVKAFEKAGIAAPPTTWAELMTDCDKLKAAGYTPFNGPASGRGERGVRTEGVHAADDAGRPRAPLARPYAALRCFCQRRRPMWPHAMEGRFCATGGEPTGD